jgi:hypothetical protein
MLETAKQKGENRKSCPEQELKYQIGAQVQDNDTPIGRGGRLSKTDRDRLHHEQSG